MQGASRLVLLKGDKRRLEHGVFEKRLESSRKFADRFCKLEYEDPFSYNETASVSALCSGAAAAGFIALAEYIAVKRASLDRRRNANGRGDFYFADAQGSWSFEFKQCFRVTPTVLNHCIDNARACARNLHRDDDERRSSGVIVSFAYTDEKLVEKHRANLMHAAQRVSYAWLIERSGKPNTAFLFEVLD